jgi:hypothetical protein
MVAGAAAAGARGNRARVCLGLGSGFTEWSESHGLEGNFQPTRGVGNRGLPGWWIGSILASPLGLGRVGSPHRT